MNAKVKITICSAYEADRRLIAGMPAMFERGEGRLLHTGRNEVRLFDGSDGRRYVAKRYKRVNAVQRVAYTFFRPTKAQRAYSYAAELRRRGIGTPHEVAYMEESEGGLFTTGYFVSAVCPDPPAFGPLVADDDFDRDMASDMASFIVFMHSRGVLHGDMNFGNFLYRRGDDGHYAFTVIDTNRSRFCDGWPDRHLCIANMRTMTHRRDVYSFIVKRYAALRGWDADETLAEALACLDKLELKHRRKDLFKKLKHL